MEHGKASGNNDINVQIAEGHELWKALAVKFS